MQTITLKGYGTNIPPYEAIELGTYDSYGVEQLQIVPSHGWENLSIIASFFPPSGAEPIKVAVLSGGIIDVPSGATAKQSGKGIIVFAGYKANTQLISTNVAYNIRDHKDIASGDPVCPTPSVVDQIVNAAKSAQEDAAAAKANADKAQADAEKAKQAAENAAADAAKAGPYAEAARAAQEAAEAAQDKAIAAQQAAENAASAAAASKSAADTLAAEAARAAQSAENSKAAANNAADLAGENATAAQQAAATATAAANDAGQSASDAAASKAAAETAAKAAQDAQTAAAEAKAEAINAQGAAQTAAKSAQDAQAAAEKARDDAKTAQQGAETARDAAAGSAEAAAKSEANAKQSADTLAESVENVVANTAAVAELKEKKAEIDDTAVGTNAWSSKHIIDMLCPPLEESGNPVVCYPVAGYPLGVKASWEPVQEGSGTPYPAGGGKNQLNPAWYEAATKTVNGITFTRSNTGEVVVNGTATGTAIYVLSANFSYPISLSTDRNWSIVGENVISAQGLVAGVTVIRPSDNTSLYIRVQSGATVKTTVQPQIKKGNTPTAWEPYENIRPIKGRDSVTVNLASGVKAWKMLTLDGTEKWKLERNYCEARFKNGNIPSSLNNLSAAKLSQKADRYSIDNAYTNTTTDKCAWVYSYPLYNFPFLRIKHTDKQSSLDDWKAYLAAQYAAGTPVQVAYKLAAAPIVPEDGGIYFAEQPAQSGSGDPNPDNVRPILLDSAVQDGGTNVLTLPETVYEGEVDAVSGEGQETWKMLTLDGTTNKFTQRDRFWGMQSNTAPGVVNGYATMCSHFPANTFGGNQTGNYIFTRADIMSRYFPDVNALNTYIAAQYAAGTPVQICYKLAEPVSFTATGAQPIPAIAGVNTVLTDADSATVTGRADPIKRITDLEDAVASQT